MKHEFTDEQVQALAEELHDGGAPCREALRNAATLILQARAERDEWKTKACESANDASMLRWSADDDWQKLRAERDAALARVRELEGKAIEHDADWAAQCDHVAALEAENAELRKTIAGYDTQCRNLWDRNAEICHSLGWDPEQPPLKRIAENERLRVAFGGEERVDAKITAGTDRTAGYRACLRSLRAALKGEEK